MSTSALPPGTWMWKPRSVHETDDGKVTAMGSGIFGAFRALGADSWNKRFVVITSGASGNVLSYGRSPGNVEKSIPLDDIRMAMSLSPQQMQQLKAPQQHLDHGWKMAFEDKDITWACESPIIRMQWVNYIRAAIGSSPANRQRGESRLSQLAQRFNADESTAAPSQPRIEDCSCVVKCVDPEELVIQLMRSRDGAKLEQTSRSWGDCENAAQVVRSLAPKADLASLSAVGMSKSQVRQRYVQSIADVIVSSPSLSHIPELVSFIGFSSYLDKYTHHTRGVAGDNSPKLPGSPRSPVEQPLDRTMDKPLQRQPSSVPRVSHRTPSAPTPVPQPKELRKDIDNAFKLIDEAGSGYLIAEDMEGFMRLLSTPQGDVLPPQVQREFDECRRASDGAFNSKAFAELVGRASKAARVTVPDWLNRYARTWFVKIYTFIGMGSSEGGPRLETHELCALKYVVGTSGLRIISANEVKRFHDSGEAFTLTLEDFIAVMSILVTVVPLERLIAALRSTHSGVVDFDYSHSRVLRCVNEAAVSEQTQSAANNIKELLSILNAGGAESAPSQADGCLRCTATEARLRSTRTEVSEMAAENEALTADLLDAESELDVAQSQIERQAASIQTVNHEVEYLSAELERSRSREHGLAERLLVAEQEIKRLQARRDDEAAADEGDITKKSTLYFLAPMSFGSSAAAPVVDLPGTIVYNLPEGFRPAGLAMDVLLTGVGGTEYLSCRDANGKRSMHWSLTSPNGRLSVIGAQYQPLLATNQWCRVQTRINWEDSTFDLYINGTLAVGKAPFRDAGVGGIAVLDVYPRKDVVVCYSNMNFFE